MALPTAGFPSREVRLSGGSVMVRGLSFEETQRDADDFTVMAISCATGTDPAEVKAWLGQVPAGDVKRLMEAITELSGLNEGAQFPVGSGDGAGDERPAVGSESVPVPAGGEAGQEPG